MRTSALVAAAGLALGGQAAAASADGTFLAKTPTFWIGSRQEGGLTDDDLSRFDVASAEVVIVGRGEGTKLTDASAERMAANACAKVKAIAPDTKCFVYFSAGISYDVFESAAEYRRLVAFESEVADFKLRKYSVFDFSSATVARWWLQEATCVARSNEDKGVNGVFLDFAYLRVNKPVKEAGAAGVTLEDRYEAYTERKISTLNKLSARTEVVLSVAPGYYRDNDTPEGRRFVDYDAPNVFLEQFCPDASSIFRLREAAGPGQKTVFALGGHRRCRRKCHKRLREYLAAFLFGLSEETDAGRALFACASESRAERDRAGELIGFAETNLPLGQPGAPVSPSSHSVPVVIDPAGFEAHRPFRSASGVLQAVAVWTAELKTVCFAQDCAPNSDPLKGKRCAGNPSECIAILKAHE